MPAVGLNSAVAGLLGVFFALVPLGYVILRGVSKFLGTAVRLHWSETLLVSFYLAGGLLYVVAALPVPVYGAPVLFGLIALGVLVAGVLLVREASANRVEWLRELARPGVWVVSVLVFALLLIEVTGVGLRSLSNGPDGAFHALFTTLILRDHELPWTLQPFANAGVLYPQGEPVWETVPVLLYGWPVYSVPMVLPCLFLALTPLGAYGWGLRVGSAFSGSGERFGTLFAGFFGLVASWPRLWVGGSYDFAVALPLFLLCAGWLGPFARAAHRSWADRVGFAGVIGIAATISASVGVALVCLLAAYLVAYRPWSLASLGRAVTEVVLALAAIGLLLARPIIAVSLWYNLPGHVLSGAGNPPYAYPVGPVVNWSTLLQQVNPFVVGQFKISPIPLLFLEVMALFVVGLVLVGARLLFKHALSLDRIPRRVAADYAVLTTTLFVLTSLMVFVAGADGALGTVLAVPNYIQISILLFLSYSVLGTVPLMIAADVASAHFRRRSERAEDDTPPTARSGRWRVSLSPTARPSSAVIASGLLLVVALSAGAVATGTSVPGYLESHVSPLSNVTAGDIAALEWAGSNLPECSRVLVAPASAAQYLPEFAVLGLVFPEYPNPVNYSYHVAVQDLTEGVLDNTTELALGLLDVTEVFVTQQTSTPFQPFDPVPMESSADFQELFHQQDAYIFAYLPDIGPSCGR